jgi:hypothetical protein
MSRPHILTEATSEYDKHSNLIPKAFPWLFPGEAEKLSITEWAKRLVLYQDGQFAKDKMWRFFGLNYSKRRKNQPSGVFFNTRRPLVIQEDL